jgi:hypothetical protein
MLDKTITSALLHLRAQIIRDGLGGIEYVNALLVLRGVNPAQHYVRRKIPQDSFEQHKAKLLVLQALRTGPKQPRDMVDAFLAAKPGLERNRVFIRLYRALRKMRDAGVLVSEGGVRRLAQ